MAPRASYRFPGMDPYLEHLVLWEGVHARLVVAAANQLQPQLDPRYVTSIEERVFIEGPQRRIPDVWIQKPREAHDAPPSEPSRILADTAIVVEVEELEVREGRVEILDAYNDMKLVAVIEIVSATNKGQGPGRESYLAKQREIMERDCHLVEIDLHRKGEHVASVPEWRARRLGAYDYLSCVSRWPARNRFELYPRRLREGLPRVKVPLATPDPDVVLDVQTLIEQVHADGRYALRVRYQEPCEPALSQEDQAWASERLSAGA